MFLPLGDIPQGQPPATNGFDGLGGFIGFVEFVGFVTCGTDALVCEVLVCEGSKGLLGLLGLKVGAGFIPARLDQINRIV